MISLQNYFIEPNYDILIETNIDQLFGIFDKQLGKIDNNKIFDQIIEKLMVQQHIEYYEYESDDSALKTFPDIKPQPLRVAMDIARSTSKTHYAPLWEKDFLRVLLSDKLLTQSGLLSLC